MTDLSLFTYKKPSPAWSPLYVHFRIISPKLSRLLGNFPPPDSCVYWPSQSGLGLHDIGSHHITCILSHAFQPIHSIGVDIEYKTSVGPRPCLETSAHLPQFALSCSKYRGPTPDPEGYFPTFDRIDRVDGRAHTASPRNLDFVALEKSLNKLCDRKYDLSVINLISNTVCWRQKYRGFADSNLFLHDCCLLIIVRPCIRSKIGRLLRKVCRVGLE